MNECAYPDNQLEKDCIMEYFGGCYEDQPDEKEKGTLVELLWMEQKEYQY